MATLFRRFIELNLIRTPTNSEWYIIIAFLIIEYIIAPIFGSAFLARAAIYIFFITLVYFYTTSFQNLKRIALEHTHDLPTFREFLIAISAASKGDERQLGWFLRLFGSDELLQLLEDGHTGASAGVVTKDQEAVHPDRKQNNSGGPASARLQKLMYVRTKVEADLRVLVDEMSKPVKKVHKRIKAQDVAELQATFLRAMALAREAGRLEERAAFLNELTPT